CALALAARTAAGDCNAPMAGALLDYSLQKLNALTRCERRHPNARCLPSDGSVTDRRTAQRLRAASRRLHGALDDACSVLPHRVGAPCGDAQSLDAVAACVVHPPVDDA